MGIIEDVGRTVRQYRTAAALSLGILGLSSCASGFSGNEPVSSNPPQQIEDGPYDIHMGDITRQSFDEILESVYKVNGEGTYRVVGHTDSEENLDDQDDLVDLDERLENKKWQAFYDITPEELEEDLEDKELEMEWHGSMGAITREDGKTVFLTAEHNIPPERIEYKGKRLRLEEGNLSYTPPADKGLIIELDVEAENSNADIALVSGEREENIYSKIANPEHVKRGDIVGGAGFPLTADKNLTFGRVTDPKEHEFYYAVDMHISPGDSGSPVYVFRDGEPLIVGIVNWYMEAGQAINGVAHIDNIIEMLEDNDITIERSTQNDSTRWSIGGAHDG